MRKNLIDAGRFLFKRRKVCRKLNIPRRLWQGRRKVNNFFPEEELIYRRFRASVDKSDWKNTHGLSTAIFDVKDDSTNRSKYSLVAEDVLYPITRRNTTNHYQSYGIVSFSVKDFNELSIVPKEPLWIDGVLREFTIHLEHRPECCMYPHTEIWVKENDMHLPKPTSRMVKTAVRDELFRIIKLEKFPL